MNQKNQWRYFCISALASKPLEKVAKTKDKSTRRLIWCYLSYIYLEYIFFIRPLLGARAEIQKYFRWFLVQMKSLEQFAFEINWPLRWYIFCTLLLKIDLSEWKKICYLGKTGKFILSKYDKKFLKDFVRQTFLCLRRCVFAPLLPKNRFFWMRCEKNF